MIQIDSAPFEKRLQLCETVYLAIDSALVLIVLGWSGPSGTEKGIQLRSGIGRKHVPIAK